MSVTAKSNNGLIPDLVILGGLLMLIDSLFGGIAVVIFDWRVFRDASIGFGLLMGLPAYVLDYWNGKRFLIYLPALFLIRWVAQSLGGTPPYWGTPWIGSELLIAAAVLLQISKLMARPKDVCTKADDPR